MSSDPAQQPPSQDSADTVPATSSPQTNKESLPRARTRSPRPNRPHLAGTTPLPKPNVNFANQAASPSSSVGQLSPAAADRVFPIRSVISVDPNPTPSIKEQKHEGYFASARDARRMSSAGLNDNSRPNNAKSITQQNQPPTPDDRPSSPRIRPESSRPARKDSGGTEARPNLPTLRSQQLMQDIIATNNNDAESVASSRSGAVLTADRPAAQRAPSVRSTKSSLDETGPLVTARFKHVISDGGHAIITGRDGETLQRCEDEPIHIPGAVQGFGLLIALEEQAEGKLIVRVVSENSKQLIGYTPKQLFALESFTDILSEEQADNLLDHIDFIRDEDADVVVNGPEVFTISIRSPTRKNLKFWCATHINDANPNLIICEFELEDDVVNPLVPIGDATPEPPEDTLNSQPTEEELAESTHNSSKPLRVLRSARKRKGEAAAMEVFNIMSQVQEQLASAPNLEKFLKILVGVVKELTGFHRVMIYQFDQHWNGRVVTELVDPRATKDLYKGLNFPASDIPKQARDLYKINKVRMLYDRDQETARLVCRTLEDLETPVDLTYSYLRAMSPIHLKYLANMAVRSSMSISINAFDELWGLIACHSYGGKGMRVSFPIRKMCRLVGDSASRNIERLSYASRLQARKLINTVPTQNNPSGYIIASSEDLLKLFDADFGLLSIRDETKILGHLEQSQEALAMLEYLRMRSVTNVMTSQDIQEDFPDLRYPPGFKEVAGLLLVPLSVGGQDFIVFFRKGQLKEVKWAGNPYEKFVKEGTEGYLEPRKSFRTWSEMVVGKCREWTEEEIETAAVLCLVYGKFIEVWRQKEAALQNSQLTRLLLANSAHEVRTPLNAIINYLEIALEGTLDQETRDNLAKSHSASKSLIYVINDLLDLTKTEEGADLMKKDEVFSPHATLIEATDMFKGDARRKKLSYEVKEHPGIPQHVIGDSRRVRQAISNVTANAIQNTTEGGVTVEMAVSSRTEDHVDIEVSVSDTGAGMSDKKLDALFRELEQVQTEPEGMLGSNNFGDTPTTPDPAKQDEQKTLGLGLAVVARIIRNMNGQLRLKSEEGKGSRFIIQFPFDLPEAEEKQAGIEGSSAAGSVTPQAEDPNSPYTPPNEGMVTLIERGSSTRSSSHDSKNTALLSRKNSVESVGTKSLGSIKSGRSNISNLSNRSGKSEADRLIEAISEPHRVEGWSESRSRASSSRGGSSHSHQRPKLESRHTSSGELNHHDVFDKSRPSSLDLERITKPGESNVTDQGQPLRPVRVPEDFVAASSPKTESLKLTAPSSPASASAGVSTPPKQTKTVNTDRMSVLVAEDDPVNSRIIQKRLEKLGHDVCLTVNGEECSGTYCDRADFFDIILMDMQMPIVDGLSSTKMIRSYGKANPSLTLSDRATLHGRVPIIAVSASLREKDRQMYIDAGFDGWILKPISFPRLSEIMEGIVDRQVRRENLYQRGSWERGGWFSDEPQDLHAVDTRPSEEPPLSAPQSEPSEGLKIAAASDGPLEKEEDLSEQTQEQTRLLEDQEEKKETGKEGEEELTPAEAAPEAPETPAEG